MDKWRDHYYSTQDIGFYFASSDRELIEKVSSIMKRNGHISFSDSMGREHYLLDGRSGVPVLTRNIDTVTKRIVSKNKDEYESMRPFFSQAIDQTLEASGLPNQLKGLPLYQVHPVPPDRGRLPGQPDLEDRLSRIVRAVSLHVLPDRAGHPVRDTEVRVRGPQSQPESFYLPAARDGEQDRLRQEERGRGESAAGERGDPGRAAGRRPALIRCSTVQTGRAQAEAV